MSELDEMLHAAGTYDTRSNPTPSPRREESGGQKDVAEAPRPKADRFIVAFYILLCLISVVELYSASSREVTSGNILGPLVRHLMMMVLGIVICIGVSRVKIKHLVVLTPWFVAISVMLMVYVLINGQIINGARRSMSILGFSIQPAELLKISSVMIIAYIMSRNQERGGVRTKGVVMCAGIVILFGGLLFTQGLTNTLLLMAISLSMMLIGGIQWRKFGLVMIFYCLIGGGAMFFKASHSSDNEPETAYNMATGTDAFGHKTTISRRNTWKNRMDRFFSDSIPKYEQPITSTNRQEMYSFMAQANGGVFGVMPGNSRETARLPLAFSDYIYSIVVEDLGFIGGLFLLVIYLSLLARAGTIAARCDRAFPSLLVMGMAVMIAFQALFHMAIVTGVFPVSGQPLPMISKGGTSMLVTSLAFGIMLSVSRYVAATSRRKSKRQEADIPENLGAVNPTQIKS